MSVGMAMMSLATLFAFQNCSDGYMSHKVQLSEKGLHNLAHVMPTSQKMEPGTDMEFAVMGSAVSGAALFKWQHSYNGIQGACTEKNGDSGASYVLNCAGAGDLLLNVDVTEVQGSFQVAYEVGVAGPPAPPAMGDEIPMTVVYEIPAGTGANPWNNVNQPVEVFIGQILQLKNLDSVTHQLHTGGRPCGHGQPIKSGETGNCIVKQSYVRATNGGIYDHNLGAKSAFYAIAYDGIRLYNQYCLSCHGEIGVSTVTGAKVSAIKGQFTTNLSMQTPALMALTQRQIEAISYALGGR